MKNYLLQLLLLSQIAGSAQCFTGLDDVYCDNYLPDTLIPLNPGGYFNGEGVSGEGVFFPDFPGTGTFVITYSNTNYYIVDTTGIYDPVEGSGTEVNLIDDGFSDGIDIGFEFEFFGSVKSFVRIHSNGFISFNFDPAIFPPYANDIPTPGMPTDLIAASWGDYDPTEGGTIEYFSAGVAPNRKLIINYTDLPPYGGDIGNLTTQIILYETTNVIEIHTTASPDYGNEKSMGIENIDGTVGFVRPGRNNAIWEAFNDYVAFIPEFCSDTTTIIEGIEISIEEDTISLCEGQSGTVHVEGVDVYEWLPPYSGLFSETATAGEFHVDATLEPGVYTCVVTGTADNGCSDNDTLILKITDCTNSIEGFSNSEGFFLYPNPVSAQLQIQKPGSRQEFSGQILIYGISGSEVYNAIFFEELPVIDVARFKNGYYILEMTTEEVIVRLPFTKLSE